MEIWTALFKGMLVALIVTSPVIFLILVRSGKEVKIRTIHVGKLPDTKTCTDEPILRLYGYLESWFDNRLIGVKNAYDLEFTFNLDLAINQRVDATTGATLSNYINSRYSGVVCEFDNGILYFGPYPLG